MLKRLSTEKMVLDGPFTMAIVYIKSLYQILNPLLFCPIYYLKKGTLSATPLKYE